MPFLNGLVGGLFAGLLSAFLIALIALLPHMGWAEYAIMPAFFLTGIPSGVLIGLRTSHPQ